MLCSLIKTVARCSFTDFHPGRRGSKKETKIGPVNWNKGETRRGAAIAAAAAAAALIRAAVAALAIVVEWVF